MLRTILVTVVSDEHNNTSEVYGRFDPVALHNKGLTIIDQYKAVYMMSDQDFVKHGEFKHKII